jgi:hypothetical protein
VIKSTTQAVGIFLSYNCKTNDVVCVRVLGCKHEYDLCSIDENATLGVILDKIVLGVIASKINLEQHLL